MKKLLLTLAISAICLPAFAQRDANDRPLFRKMPIGGGSSGDDPDVPGCVSLTASQECLHGRTCVDSYEQYTCCTADDGTCMTLVTPATGSWAAAGIMLRERASGLLPYDIIIEIDGVRVDQLGHDLAIDLLGSSAFQVRYLREVRVPSGETYCVTGWSSWDPDEAGLMAPGYWVALSVRLQAGDFVPVLDPGTVLRRGKVLQAEGVMWQKR